ncbi:MAG: hypothetical protein ACLQO7_05615 [Candidatus Bathyarchaeia archaeon]
MFFLSRLLFDGTIFSAVVSAAMHACLAGSREAGAYPGDFAFYLSGLTSIILERVGKPHRWKCLLTQVSGFSRPKHHLDGEQRKKWGLTNFNA